MYSIPTFSRVVIALFALLVTTQASTSQTVLYQLSPPSPDADGMFGWEVELASDVNGDGIADFLIGAPNERVGSFDNVGRVHIYSGGNGGLLRTIPGSAGIPDANFGFSVVDVGDVDGDALADFLIGSPNLDSGGESVGWTTLVTGPSSRQTFFSPTPTEFGRFGESLARMDDITGDDTTDFAIGARGDGVEEYGRVHIFRGGTDVDFVETWESPNAQQDGAFGHAIARVGDLDGDGIADLLVGAPNEEAPGTPSGSGRAYVLSGATGVAIHTLTSPTPTFAAAFGIAVSSAGDVNGDALDDLIVSGYDSPGASPSFAGRAYVFDGASGAVLLTLASPHQQQQGFFGISVASAGDASGDGVPDILVGASSETGDGGEVVAGRAYLFDGVTGDVLQELESPNLQAGGRFGQSVAPAGDVNGDGIGDLLIGARGEDIGLNEEAGRAYVFAGIDVAAPILTVGAPTRSLWPANSAYYAFDLASLQITASDHSDPDVSADDVVLTHVASDEPEDMPGNRDGATSRDITITFDCRSASVRAERDSKHNGRVYTMHLAVADAAGNIATATYRVAAPIRRDGAAIRDLDAYTVTGCDPVTGAPALAEGHPSVEAGPTVEFELEPNAPNPFDNQTRIGFSLAEAVDARLIVFDVLGREVARLADGRMEAGRHSMEFETGALPAGSYLYRLEAGLFVATRRMMVAR